MSTNIALQHLNNFLADDQLNKNELLALIELAINIKQKPADYSQALAGKSVAMIFEKPSLRTHVSFDMGISKLGGHALYLGQQNGKLGERERVSDYAKNLSCFADAIVARVFSHDSIQGLAEHASVPVINALCDVYHPCQALADFVTLSETYPDLSQVKLAYVGDGNNVSNSLMIMAAFLCLESEYPPTLRIKFLKTITFLVFRLSVNSSFPSCSIFNLVLNSSKVLGNL